MAIKELILYKISMTGFCPHPSRCSCLSVYYYYSMIPAADISDSATEADDQDYGRVYAHKRGH
jgi:hypothetical protein